jgi:hypothetical protein
VIRMRETVVNQHYDHSPPFTFTLLKKENFPDCWPVRLRPCTIVMEQRRVWLFFLFNVLYSCLIKIKKNDMRWMMIIDIENRAFHRYITIPALELVRHSF